MKLNKKGFTSTEIIILIVSIFMLSYVLIATIKGEKLEKERKETTTIAQVIASEGCGEGNTGMFYISNTIKNRSEQWNKTPYEIVTQPNQYYGLNNPNKIQLYNQCKEMADYFAENVLKLPDMIYGALYFRQPEEIRQKWHKEETKRYKNHIFYK